MTVAASIEASAPDPRSSGSEVPLFARWERPLLVLLAFAAFLLGVGGIARLGYIGQDFPPHQGCILTFPTGFEYYQTDPAGFYLLGNALYRYVSGTYYLEWLALVMLVFNTLTLGLLYRFIWQSVTLSGLRWSAALLLTFLPVRVIHAIVIAADAPTVPLFLLVALFALQLREDPRSKLAWVGLALTLSLGLVSKYTFLGLLPPVFLLYVSTLVQRLPAGSRRYWAKFGLISLALPTAVISFHLWKNVQQEGAITSGHWLPPGAPSVMRWSDLLLLKRSDLELLSAPEYFRGGIFQTRRYSYPGLVYLCSVTDPMNLFQPPPVDISVTWIQRYRESFFRARSEEDQTRQGWAVYASLPYVPLAVAGTLLAGFLSLRSLLTGRGLANATVVVLTALAAGYYSPIFLGLHRVLNPYEEGYWAPCLILPALLVFLLLGFWLLDRLCLRWRSTRPALRFLPPVVALWTGFTCLIYLGFLA